MWSLIYKQRINISHYLSLEYSSESTDAHGHLLDISLTFIADRLNANNMVIDTDLIKQFLIKLNGDINNYMRINNIRGNATLENILLIIKIKVLDIIQKFNLKYTTNVNLININIQDETGRQVNYNFQ